MDNIVECLAVSGGLVKDVLGLVTNGGGLEDIATIVSRASIYDAVELADKGASVAEIVQFVNKGQDLFTVGQVIEKGVKSADLLSLINKGARAEEVLGLLDKGATVEEISTLLNKGVSLSKVMGWLNNGVTIENLRYVMAQGTIEKTINIFKRESQVIWLEEGMMKAEANTIGKKPSGWKHIYEDHIKDYDGPGNDFANAFGFQYRSAESIQNLIYESVQKGTMNPSDVGVYYYKVTDEKAIETVVGGNGYIVTSYPLPIKDVPISL